MKERKDAIKANGEPLTLLGEELKVGDRAPDATLIDNNMKPFAISTTRGKVTIISVVTSLDTSVCDVETRKFNQEAGSLGGNIQILTISMDLPFAQKRWCGAAGVERVKTLSDYKDASFGLAYGVLIKELRLLARIIFVVDPSGIIRHIQTVKDNAMEPDYAEVLSAAKKLV